MKKGVFIVNDFSKLCTRYSTRYYLEEDKQVFYFRIMLGEKLSSNDTPIEVTAEQEYYFYFLFQNALSQKSKFIYEKILFSSESKSKILWFDIPKDSFMNDGWVQHKNLYITVKMANYDFKNDFPAPYFIPQHSSEFVNRLYDINCIEDSSLQYRFNNSINTHRDFDSQSKPYLGKNIEDNALHDSDDFYENSSSNNINNYSGHHSSIQYDSCQGSIGSSFDGYANYSVNNSTGNYIGNSIRSHGSANNSVDSSTVDNSDIKYVGLQNQGATCYMNSMLQAFFHLPAFRKLVYKMPTEGVEDETKNIPLNLQKLFTKMQCSKTSCSTTALTKSFGWNDADTFTQHDVQEFCRVLVDNLETKMKKSELDGEIAKIFRGKYNRYIRCVNVDYETSKIEEFYDLSMVVKDTFNLEESFKKYIEPELLSGDNQYQTDKHGKQDVNVGIEFLEFPSVLHLHLRRFEFNFYTEQ